MQEQQKHFKCAEGRILQALKKYQLLDKECNNNKKNAF